MSPDAPLRRGKFVDYRKRSRPFAVENPIRSPEKRPSGGLSVITVGRYSALRSSRFVAPRRFLAPPGRFSVCRSPGLLQGFLRERARAIAVVVREFPW